jgi:hypothetical protein
MIEFFSNDTLGDASLYALCQSTVESNANRYMKLGYNKDLSFRIHDFGKENSGIVYAKENDRIVGFVIFDNKESLDKMMFDIQLDFYESQEVYKKLYEFVENFAKSLGCVYINQSVLIKDVEIINDLESIGFKKEFCLMYKKV